MSDDRKHLEDGCRRSKGGTTLRVLMTGRPGRTAPPPRAAYEQSRARAMLNGVLNGPLPPVVELSGFLTRVCSLAQMSMAAVGTLMTAVEAERMVARRARPLAVALVEMIHFAAADVPDGEQLTLQVAVVRDGEDLILGIAVYGAFMTVPSLEASRALQRAREIVRTLGAEFQRGACGERMVLGVTYRCGAMRSTNGDASGD